MVDLEREALAAEEKPDIEDLLDRIAQLPTDSKLASLKRTLADLRHNGYEQAMVFTQYTDTMDFLRRELQKDATLKLMCFSGRGGEIPAADGDWRQITRGDAKRRFRDGEAHILLCTDAAAEGLNFQFCGALVNYDMPWNPMRVEQRIGLFKSVVGRLQPILARMPRTISETVLSGGRRSREDAAELVDRIQQEAQAAEKKGFDLDAVTEEDLAMPPLPASPVTMHGLDRIIGRAGLMPPGTKIRPMGHREYSLLAPGMKEPLRVTTDPDYYEENADSVEFWSPGSPLFTPPEFAAKREHVPSVRTLKEILDT